MIKTLDFKAPADLVEEAVMEAVPTGVNPLLGTWKNCDSATRGVVRVVITAAGKGISVRVFGACHPTPCDWGAVTGHAYSANVGSNTAIAFTATYKFDFKDTVVTGSLDRGYLTVETFDHFTDGSGRMDYYSKALCRH